MAAKLTDEIKARRRAATGRLPPRPKEKAPPMKLKVSELKPGRSSLELDFKVVAKPEAREVLGRDQTAYKICDVLIGDESGCAKLVVWNERIGDLEVGKCYNVNDCYTSVFHYLLKLNMTKESKLREIKKNLGNVDTMNNISEKIQPIRSTVRRRWKRW